MSNEVGEGVRRTAFITNVTQYAGEPAAAALVARGWHVFGHDLTFASEKSRRTYESTHPGRTAARSLTPAEFVTEGLSAFGGVVAVISNDVPYVPRPAQTTAPAHEDEKLLANLDDFESLVDALTIQPVRLIRAALPHMLANGGGSILFVTSGAPLRTPLLGGTHGYTAARAATNTLAKSLAAQLASRAIQVNAVAPFLVYSQTFFPSSIGPEDPVYEPILKELVPMARFGSPTELGQLIASLVSGELSFVSGQVIAFSGAGC